MNNTLSYPISQQPHKYIHKEHGYAKKGEKYMISSRAEDILRKISRQGKLEINSARRAMGREISMEM
ncbi:hypothetical protein MIDIC_110067 [Alphaproteobacteria bacterium]